MLLQRERERVECSCIQQIDAALVQLLLVEDAMSADLVA